MPAEYAVVVTTCDKYSWLLRPFSYLFNIYWSGMQQVYVFSDAKMRYHLPHNFKCYMPRTEFDAGHYSDGLIDILASVQTPQIVLLLDDYWLTRPIDHRALDACVEVCKKYPQVLRIDLTSDRLYAGGMFDAFSFGCYDFIETPAGTPYQFSTQAGMWNRARLLEVLVKGKTPWDLELQTQVPPSMRVLGTRQYPVRYINVIHKAKLAKGQLEKLATEHKEKIQYAGWIPDWETE